MCEILGWGVHPTRLSSPHPKYFSRYQNSPSLPSSSPLATPASRESFLLGSFLFFFDFSQPQISRTSSFIFNFSFSDFKIHSCFNISFGGGRLAASTVRLFFCNR